MTLTFREKLLTHSALIIGSICVVVWFLVGPNPENAVRVAFIGGFALLSIIVGFMVMAYKFVRETNPKFQADAPPVLWIALFAFSYLLLLTFVAEIAVLRSIADEPINPILFATAVGSYLTGFLSASRLIIFLETRLIYKNKWNHDEKTKDVDYEQVWQAEEKRLDEASDEENRPEGKGNKARIRPPTVP